MLPHTCSRALHPQLLNTSKRNQETKLMNTNSTTATIAKERQIEMRVIVGGETIALPIAGNLTNSKAIALARQLADGMFRAYTRAYEIKVIDNAPGDRDADGLIFHYQMKTLPKQKPAATSGPALVAA